ncbi:hypothetical protein EV188_11112 [Actinomycetospora succinea]|uniref:Uncharacterized protein n=1 Tax=Actinomycetospora succinea TaxID=663603 RepID=A0A4R6UPM2_9PSEU|nr:hypothetical protein [Actinomycetospora succinea]TDQ48842.1 hypothetical protein EV188_11112 [Actinomycetospora succinea]
MTVDVQDRPATRLAAVSARRRRLEEQVATLRSFEGRLTDEVRAARKAAGRADRVRELLSRLVGVRARLQETEVAVAVATTDEDGLRDDAHADAAALDEARREAEEREAFHRACLEAPMVRLARPEV